MKNVPPLSGKK
jgi:hypothetical protein